MDDVRRDLNDPDMAGEWKEPSVDAHSFPYPLLPFLIISFQTFQIIIIISYALQIITIISYALQIIIVIPYALQVKIIDVLLCFKIDY